MKKYVCSFCQKQIPQNSSHCVFCGKRQQIIDPSDREDPKATYRGVATSARSAQPSSSNEEEPKTVRRPSLSAFAATRSIGNSQHLPAFELKEVQNNEEPSLHDIQQKNTSKTHYQVNSNSSLPAGFETLPLAPVIDPDIDPEAYTRKNISTISQNQQSGKRSIPPPNETSQSSKEEKNTPREPLAPDPWETKRFLPKLSEKTRENQSDFSDEKPLKSQGSMLKEQEGFDTLLGVAPLRASKESSFSSSEMAQEESDMVNTIPVGGPPLEEDAIETIPGNLSRQDLDLEVPAYLQSDEKIFSEEDEDEEAIETLPGNFSSKELFHADSPTPDAKKLPTPPGKVVATMPEGEEEDVIKTLPVSYQAVLPPEAAPLPARPTLMAEQASIEEKSLTLAENPNVKGENTPSWNDSQNFDTFVQSDSKPNVSFSPSLQVSLEKSKEISETANEILVPSDEEKTSEREKVQAMPWVQERGPQTDEIIRKAEFVPFQSSEEVLPGRHLTRVLGIFGGILLLGAALAPVTISPFVAPWNLFGSEAFLLIAWAFAGFLGIIASALPILPKWRGFLIALGALPALILGTVWALPLFLSLLENSLVDLSAQNTTSSLSELVPIWRVSFAFLAWTLLPTGLFYRRFASSSRSSRLLVTAGIAFVFANYLIPVDGQFVSSLLGPIFSGTNAVPEELLSQEQISPLSLLFLLLKQSDELLLFFGTLLLLPAVIAVFCFLVFLPGEKISTSPTGKVETSTHALYTGLSGVWVTFYLLYLPIPFIALGLFLLSDPGQQSTGLTFIRFGLASGAIPLLFSLGTSQFLTSFSVAKS